MLGCVRRASTERASGESREASGQIRTDTGQCRTYSGHQTSGQRGRFAGQTCESSGQTRTFTGQCWTNSGHHHGTSGQRRGFAGQTCEPSGQTRTNTGHIRTYTGHGHRTSGQRSGFAGLFLLLLLVLLCLSGVEGTGGVTLGAQLVCAQAAGLTDKQRAMCRASPAAIAAIGDGLRMAYAECRVQLSGRRWNCSGVGDGNHFGHVMPLATREAAFTYAITSAGVTHALSAACARGDLPACGCAPNRRRGGTRDQFEWGGCGGGGGGAGEAAHGARLARRFLDARELENDARALMNLHNNRVGRKIIKELVRRECKCHGVSGSCTVRTCWRALPPFRAAAAALAARYHRARLVVPAALPAPLAQPHLVVRRGRAGPERAARKAELVYLAPSPTYCEPDPAAGSLGTHGRLCNRTATGAGGCGVLCCGRGHSTRRGARAAQCRCRFTWCCRVACDTCLDTTELTVCN